MARFSLRTLECTGRNLWSLYPRKLAWFWCCRVCDNKPLVQFACNRCGNISECNSQSGEEQSKKGSVLFLYSFFYLSDGQKTQTSLEFPDLRKPTL
jgi:hypothetical protein